MEEGWKRRETNDREVWFRVFCQKIGLFCGTRKMEGEGGVPEGRGVNKRWIPTVVTGIL